MGAIASKVIGLVAPVPRLTVEGDGALFRLARARRACLVFFLWFMGLILVLLGYIVRRDVLFNSQFFFARFINTGSALIPYLFVRQQWRFAEKVAILWHMTTTVGSAWVLALETQLYLYIDELHLSVLFLLSAAATLPRGCCTIYISFDLAARVVINFIRPPFALEPAGLRFHLTSLQVFLSIGVLMRFFFRSPGEEGFRWPCSGGGTVSVLGTSDPTIEQPCLFTDYPDTHGIARKRKDVEDGLESPHRDFNINLTPLEQPEASDPVYIGLPSPAGPSVPASQYHSAPALAPLPATSARPPCFISSMRATPRDPTRRVTFGGVTSEFLYEGESSRPSDDVPCPPWRRICASPPRIETGYRKFYMPRLNWFRGHEGTTAADVMSLEPPSPPSATRLLPQCSEAVARASREAAAARNSIAAAAAAAAAADPLLMSGSESPVTPERENGSVNERTEHGSLSCSVISDNTPREPLCADVDSDRGVGVGDPTPPR